MHCRRRIAAGLAALGVGVAPATGPVRGQEHEHKQAHSHPKTTQATPHTHHQAGHPQCVSRLAVPSYNDHYSGHYVGGGKAFGGQGRCPNEGTWGWDYSPFRPMSPRIFMNWSHGRHQQGGTRGYATDGPKPLEHLSESVHERLSHE